MPQAKRAVAAVSDKLIGRRPPHDLSTPAADATAIGSLVGYGVFGTPSLPQKAKLGQNRPSMKIFEHDAVEQWLYSVSNATRVAALSSAV